MILNTGDKVKFLNDVGEGQVTAILDKKTVMVSTQDGFDIPVLMGDLIKVESAKKESEIIVSQKLEVEEKIKEETEDEEIPATDDEIVFALRIKNNSEIFSYLLNMSSYHLYYTLSIKKEGENLFLQGGKLEPEMQVNLPRIIPPGIDENIVLYVNILFYGKSFYKAIPPINRKIEFIPSDLYSGLLLKENDYFENKAALFPLHVFNESKAEFTNTTVEGDLKKILEEKEGFKKPAKKIDVPKQSDIIETDLHIQSITDDFMGLTNGEILEIQMARFKTSLQTAIIHKTRRIVFIHGVGNGKLKYELMKSLDKDYPDLKYQDASFKEYGYGATMVIIPA